MIGYGWKGFGSVFTNSLAIYVFVGLMLPAWSLDAGLAVAQNAEGWLPGFGTYVSGEYIGYRSAIPEAMDAILVRSLEEER